jgi:cytochrome c553
MRQGLPAAVGLAMLFGSVSGPALAQGDVKAGKLKADTCMGCHGIPGYTTVYPTYHVPKLGGQHAEYIVSALEAYKTGLRDHETMHAQAESLSSKDMADIAAYFESLDSEVATAPKAQAATTEKKATADKESMTKKGSSAKKESTAEKAQ